MQRKEEKNGKFREKIIKERKSVEMKEGNKYKEERREKEGNNSEKGQT